MHKNSILCFILHASDSCLLLWNISYSYQIHLFFFPYRQIFHTHCETSVSTTSGHADHYFNFILMPFFSSNHLLDISVYSVCSLFLLRSICILFAMQEKNRIHSILLPALLRVQRHPQVIFLSWTLFYLISPSLKRVATAFLYYFLCLLSTLLQWWLFSKT